MRFNTCDPFFSRRCILAGLVSTLALSRQAHAQSTDAGATTANAKPDPPEPGYVIFNRETNSENINSLIMAIEYLSRFNVSDITIMINSTGGSVEAAVQFYNYASSSDIVINTVNSAQVSSAANILFLSGKNRYAPESCYFFMHPVANSNSVTNATLKSYAELQASLSASEGLMRSIYKSKTRFSKEEIDKFFQDQVILDSSEAFKKGLATSTSILRIKEAGLKVVVADPPQRYIPMFSVGD